MKIFLYLLLFSNKSPNTRGNKPISAGLFRWESWVDHRKSLKTAEIPPNLEHITNEDLNYWLARFVMEVRNQNGQPYVGGTLYGLCAALQRYVREKRAILSQGEPLDIYKDPRLDYFRKTFDVVLKDLHRQGIGASKKQADVISIDMEERLWDGGYLGDDEPQKLLNSLVFCLGLNLALRSGQEHRRLSPDMFTVVEGSDENRSYLLYTEFGSKNNAGGLKDRKVKNKSVTIFANLEKTSKCVIHLYAKYMSLRPFDAPPGVLYLQPLSKPKPDCWYQSRPVGHNALNKTVKSLCDKIGATGHFTNHSLRRTCATRLYNSGVGEQEIMAITGHRSKDGVRLYKKMSEDQEKELSEILQSSAKKAKCEKELEDVHVELENKENICPLSRKDSSGSSFSFNGCSVTINYN